MTLCLCVRSGYNFLSRQSFLCASLRRSKRKKPSVETFTHDVVEFITQRSTQQSVVSHGFETLCGCSLSVANPTTEKNLMEVGYTKVIQDHCAGGEPSNKPLIHGALFGMNWLSPGTGVLWVWKTEMPNICWLLWCHLRIRMLLGFFFLVLVFFTSLPCSHHVSVGETAVNWQYLLWMSCWDWAGSVSQPPNTRSRDQPLPDVCDHDQMLAVSLMTVQVGEAHFHFQIHEPCLLHLGLGVGREFVGLGPFDGGSVESSRHFRRLFLKITCRRLFRSRAQ